MKDGVHELGRGLFCYCQDCNQGSGWGWSNSGLIVDGDQALLVDTLRDEKLTGKMLAAYQDATGLAARDIGTLVNTHSDGDHTYGNRLMKHARMISSRETARDVAARPPSIFLGLLENRPKCVVGDFMFSLFGPPFDFVGVEPTLPSESVERTMSLKVGDKKVELIKVGPAHTAGDVLVHVPGDRIVYTGDIVFYTNTPILWAGPQANWIDALDRILAMDVDIVVPGHGPVTDKSGVRKIRQYLVYIEQESRKRYDAGMSLEDAIEDIELGEFEDWGSPERIVVNVNQHYCRFSGKASTLSFQTLMEMMAPYAARNNKRKRDAAAAACCPT
jgi:cyclase